MDLIRSEEALRIKIGKNRATNDVEMCTKCVKDASESLAIHPDVKIVRKSCEFVIQT
jgi:hypothetical protein